MGSHSDLLSQLQQLKQNIPKDESVRKELVQALRTLGYELETPQDTITRVIYLPLQMAIARVAINLKLFDILAKGNEKGFTTNELAEKTGVNYVLLRRILQYLAAYGMVGEVGEDSFVASNVTKNLTIDFVEGGLMHCFDTCMPPWQKLPKFLAATKYENPADSANCAFQPGHNTDLHPYKWFSEHPEEQHNFNVFMMEKYEGTKTWLDGFPFEEELCHNLSPKTPLFVDVGGGVGHQCQAFKQKYPNIPGRVILEDLPQTVQEALTIDGVEVLGHDFWQPQPIKGARAYYMRAVLHNYPDSKCIELLKLTKAAMAPDSVILIDEMVIPSRNVNIQAAQADLTMMTCLAAMERSEKQWDALVRAAGLKIAKIYPYTVDFRNSIIAAVPC